MLAQLVAFPDASATSSPLSRLYRYAAKAVNNIVVPAVANPARPLIIPKPRPRAKLNGAFNIPFTPSVAMPPNPNTAPPVKKGCSSKFSIKNLPIGDVKNPPTFCIRETITSVYFGNKSRKNCDALASNPPICTSTICALF